MNLKQAYYALRRKGVHNVVFRNMSVVDDDSVMYVDHKNRLVYTVLDTGEGLPTVFRKTLDDVLEAESAAIEAGREEYNLNQAGFCPTCMNELERCTCGSDYY